MPVHSRVALLLSTAWLLAQPLPAAQSLLNWSADDGDRIERLSGEGSRIDGEHIVLWFPASLSRPAAEALVKRLDPAVAVLRRRIGTHAWQAVTSPRLTYYLSDDAFVSHATGHAAVFIPIARVKDGRAPYLHEATHEWLASATVEPRASEPGRRPLWLTEGLAEYIAQLAASEASFTERGPFDIGGMAGVDRTCVERGRTADGATMLPFVGATERPEVLFTTDRPRFAPTFYACAFSFNKFLAERMGLDQLIAVMAAPPSRALEAIQRLTRREMVDLNAEWRTALGLR